jgi:hypothetical protein
MIFAENRFPLFRIMPEGRLAPKKEARPKGPGTPCSLRRNIVRNRGKTTRNLSLLRKIPGHFRRFGGPWPDFSGKP